MSDPRTITSLLGGTVPLRDLDRDTMTLILNSISRLSDSFASERAEKILVSNYRSALSTALNDASSPALGLVSMAARQLLKNGNFNEAIDLAGRASKTSTESLLAEIFAASVSSKSTDSFLNAIRSRLHQEAEPPPTQHVRPDGIEGTAFGTLTVTLVPPALSPAPSVITTISTGPEVSAATPGAVPAWVWFFLLTMLQILSSWNDAREGLADIVARVPPTAPLAEMRKELRIQLSGKPGDYRMVKAKRLNLRAAPSMKGEVIIQLKEGDLVAVLAKEDRTWLNVMYKWDGVWIEGYVSTKHLRSVRP